MTKEPSKKANFVSKTSLVFTAFALMTMLLLPNPEKGLILISMSYRIKCRYISHDGFFDPLELGPTIFTYPSAGSASYINISQKYNFLKVI